MNNFKHVGRFVSNKRKVIVAYRTIPGDAEYCLVVQTATLDADMHDALITLVESSTGQQAAELADAMARARVPDGRIMLAALHTTGKLNKIKTSEIEMTPNTNTAINLATLNQTIAESKGVSIEDLAIGSGKPPVVNEAPVAPVSEVSNEPVAPLAATETTILTDEQLADQYRAQATEMTREAKRLREEAEKLVPAKKPAAKRAPAKKPAAKTTAKKSSSSASK